MFDLEFNNKTASSMGVMIAKRPDIPAPKKKIKTIEIPGRDGKLIQSDGTYEDITIEVEMNFVASPLTIGERFRAIKSWILNGKGKLVFDDDMEVFYKVKQATIDSLEREVREAGTFKVAFLCEPYTYLASGEREVGATSSFNNLYETAHPIYKITGNGMCSLTVNGKTVRANIGQNLTIDTELMMAYRADGTLNNTAITGNYEDLYLKNGSNSVAVTTGFNLKVIPNWRCL